MYGPSNYDSIVSSKLAIAQALRDDVVPVLQGAGATAGYYADAARETLYQQMLVQLSDAYNVTSVIQYPVDVASPVSANAGPPRSGTVTPDLYVSPAGTPGFQTLKTAADAFAVSVPFLAQTIAAVPNLLQPGATVTYGTGSYIIQPGDTLNAAATALGVPTDPWAAGYWETWTPFAEAIGGQLILNPAAALPVTGVSHKAAGVDTFSSVASFAGVTAPLLAEANQTLPGHDQRGNCDHSCGLQTIRSQRRRDLPRHRQRHQQPAHRFPAPRGDGAESGYATPRYLSAARARQAAGLRAARRQSQLRRLLVLGIGASAR